MGDKGDEDSKVEEANPKLTKHQRIWTRGLGAALVAVVRHTRHVVCFGG
jgi:hypothetical protein